MSEDEDIEGFDIHPVSVAIRIQRPGYKPLKKKEDPVKVDDKEKLIMEIMVYGSTVFDRMSKRKSCCFSSSDLDIDRLDAEGLEERIREKIAVILENLSIPDSKDKVNFLEGLTLASIYQEAKRSDFSTFYKTRDLFGQINAIKTSIAEYKRHLIHAIR